LRDGYNDYRPWSGWYFGACGSVMASSPEGQSLLRQAECEGLPGTQENWFALLAAHTMGYERADLRLLAERCEASGNGVWHECNKLYNERHPDKPTACPCGMCKKSRPLAGIC
jgi:hypothetical protein